MGARTNEMHDPVFPNGAAACEVEIDPNTGKLTLTRYATVDDVGRCINPMIVHGQTHGGIAQGVGQAMGEVCIVEPESGQVLSGSFLDYWIPRSDTMPSFITEIPKSSRRPIHSGSRREVKAAPPLPSPLSSMPQWMH
jgi:carbon-monoxide dehydrogenase large subunit